MIMDLRDRHDISELFDLLESNHQSVVADIKRLIHENFLTTKDSWLVNGLYDYFLTTNSTCSIDILLGIREPHDKFLLDRLVEGIRGSGRLQALAVLGHVVRKQPTWLYKVTVHPLMRELIKLMKNETDVLNLMSALLTLVTLLPIIPSLLTSCLPDIFDIFSRLSTWITTNPSQVPKEHLLHLQVGLYALFHRLYGLFPCNFLSYLRNNYGQRENHFAFIRIIKPMLYTVRMHPLLITASKEAEIASARWKHMEHHDVLVECSKFSVDLVENSMEESNSYTPSQAHRRSFDSVYIQRMTPSSLQQPALEDTELWSPSFTMALNEPMSAECKVVKIPDKSLPPEAAVEATPETTPLTTPVKECYDYRSPGTVFNFASVLSSPSGVFREASVCELSQRDSLTRADSFSWERRDSLFTQRLQKVNAERIQAKPQLSPLKIPTNETSCLAKPLEDPSSEPKQSVISEEHHVVLIEPTHESQEEPLLRVREPTVHLVECFDEMEQSGESTEVENQNNLTITDSKSMMDFAQRVRRLRFYSQCGAGNLEELLADIATEESVLRRTTSCPDMQKHMKVDVAKEGSTMDVKLETPLKVVETCATQTDDFWPFMLYEHLFVTKGKGLDDEDDVKSESTTANLNPHQILQQCLQVAGNIDITDTKTKDAQVGILQKQVALLNYQLLFERHRREVHAERNRRLASKSKSMRALEEYNEALKDQVALLDVEMKTLVDEAAVSRKKWRNEEKVFQNIIKTTQDQLVSLQNENTSLVLGENILLDQIRTLQVKLDADNKEVGNLQTLVFHLQNDISKLEEESVRAKRLDNELDKVNSELVLMGELQIKLREQLMDVHLQRQSERELHMIREACHQEVTSYRNQMEVNGNLVDAFRSRVSELESIVSHKDLVEIEQKKLLKATKEDAEEKIQAVESKYLSLKAANQQLECHILELHRKLEQHPVPRTTAAMAMARSPGNYSGHSDLDSASPGCRSGTGSNGIPTHQSGEQFLFGSPQLSESLENLELVVGSEEATIQNIQTQNNDNTDMAN